MASGLKVDSMARLLVMTILEEDAKHPSDVDIQESVARSLQDKIKKVKMNGDVKPSVPTHEDPSELPVEELPELSFPIQGNSSLWDQTTSFNNFSGKDGLIYEQVPIGRGTMVEVSLPCDTCQEVVRVNIPRLQDGDQRMFLGTSPIECKPCSKQRYKHSFKSAKGREERRESAIEWLERRAAVHNKWICVGFNQNSLDCL
jgi:hypothetical protein